jgi:hypothetical protein
VQPDDTVRWGQVIGQIPEAGVTLPLGSSVELIISDGTPIDGPPEGAVLGVMGVADGDVLNVRDGPGVAYDIIATLDPVTDTVVATGRSQLLPASIWVEVTVGATTGWVNSQFLTSFSLAQGERDDNVANFCELVGCWYYSVSLFGFPSGTSVTVTCHSTFSGPFYTDTITIDEDGSAFNPRLCFSRAGQEHWVTIDGVPSNRLQW